MEGMKKYLVVFIVVLGSLGVRGQSLPVGSLGLEDGYRRAQLLGLVDSCSSFTSLPLFPAYAFKVKDVFDPFNGLENNRFKKFEGEFKFGGDKLFVKLLPVQWVNQYNSHHPEGLNDGAMIPAKGYQTMVSAGIYAQYGPLSIQLNPEFVYAANEIYPGFPHTRVEDPVYADQLWYHMYTSVYNYIDQPERFGDKSYKKSQKSSFTLSS